MDMEQIRDFFASSPFAWVAAGAALALLTLGGQRLFLWLRQLYRDWRERRELAIDILDIAETGTVRDVDVALERGLEINKATAHGNALHVAAGRNRNLPFLRRLLAAGVDARAQNVFGLTPLHVLARYGDIPEAVAAFVAAGADVNAAVNGYAPLHAAAANPCIEMLRAILAAGANPNPPADQERPPLFIALETSLEHARLLLDAGADANAHGKDGWTPLLAAIAVSDDPEAAVDLLLARGAQATAANDGGCNAAHAWAQGNRQPPSLLRKLVAAGAGVNATLLGDQTTPLIALMANEKATPEALEALLAAGADPTRRTRGGGTALHWAAQGHPWAVPTLIAAGAEVDAADGDGVTPLMLAAYVGANQETPSLLLAAGANVNARDKRGYAPLHHAVGGKGKDVDAIVTLLRNGAEVNARAKDGRTPLHAALDLSPNPEAHRLLVDAGADLKAKDRLGRTPLLAAAAHAPRETLELLLERGAKLRVSDKNNKTPLMYAAESNARDCVQLLLERGAQTKPHDANFRTALDYAAASNPNPEIVRDLARAGLKPNRCDYPGIPPLHWAAAANPNPEICAALLGLGADPLRRDAYGRRPLDWALAATIAEKEGMTDADRQKAEETLAAKIAILEQAEKAELRAKPWRRLAHLALWLPPRSRARRAIIKATANIGENTRFLMVFIVFSALYLLLVSTGLVTPPVFFVVFFSLCFLLRETA